MFKREIHKRESNGITVTLFAHFEINSGVSETVECIEISCHVVDSHNGTEFTISDIPDEKALDVFYHPFASGKALLETGKLPC